VVLDPKPPNLAAKPNIFSNIISRKAAGKKQDSRKKRQKTRNQTVARIANRTASQHLQGSRDVIGHVII